MGLWAGEDAVTEVAMLRRAAWMAKVRSSLTVSGLVVGSGDGAWVAAAAAVVGADGDVIHMGRLLMAGTRSRLPVGGPLVVVW